MPSLTNPFPAGPSRRAWLSVGAPIFGLVVLVLVFALGLLLRFAHQQDDAFRRDSRNLVASAIDARLHAAADVALDFAIWDAAHDAVTGRVDEVWLRENYRSWVADALIVFRPRETSRYIWYDPAFENEAGEMIRKTRRAAARLFDIDDRFRAPASRALASTVAALDHEVALIGVAPITREGADERRPQGGEGVYLAAVMVMRSPEIAALGDVLGLEEMRFQPQGGVLPARSVSFPIVASDGAVAGRLVWRDEQPGAAGLRGQIWLVVFGLLLAGALAFVCARALVARQVGDTVRAEAALESSRLKSEFISTMSHELRTPLNAIIGYGELIEEETTAPEPSSQTMRQDVGRVLAAARHLNRLVNDTLDQARIDAGKLPLNLEPLDIGNLLVEVTEIIEPLALANGNTMAVRIAPGTPQARADHVRLRQCLLNLVGNAVKFTERGVVTLSARSVAMGGAGMVAISVSDTGIGIARSQQERVFSPYAQADASLQDGAGVGLGLSISRKLARAMGGDIRVQSELGKGATFTLTVPAANVPQLLESA